MSRQSVYEGLKSALVYKKLPYHHFEDDDCTIAFESWEQYLPFDRLLDSLPIPNDLKFNIYAERVDGRSDGMAVTVSDEIQHLTYWDMYFDMKGKVATFEAVISIILRSGVVPLAYDYRFFDIDLLPADYYLLPPNSAPHYVSDWQDKMGRQIKTIHLDFPE